MRNNIWRWTAGFLVIVLSGAAAHANLAKGDKPTLSFTAVDGTKVDLANLQGKLVLVDFWATWCGPCMAEAGHMVKVNQDYGDKGLVMLGISLDTDVAKMKQVAQSKEFTWLQCCDGKMWESPFARAWGVNGIPHTFLFGPDGALLWDGHPAAGMDQAIADAMKNHPPLVIDVSVMNQATGVLDEVEAALKSHDSVAAIKAMAKFPGDAAKEPKLAGRLSDDQKALGASADGLLAEADELVAQKQYVQAQERFKTLVVALAGTPTETQAAKKLAALEGDPAIKAQIDSAEKAAKADAVLAIAQKLKAEKKDDLAYPKFKEIVALYAGTTAAATAAQEVKNYEQDAAFMGRISQKTTVTKAKADMGLADSYRAAGQNDLARKKYRQVIAQFPNTEFAKKAQQNLDEMGEN